MRSKNGYEVEVGDWLWTNTNPPEVKDEVR